MSITINQQNYANSSESVPINKEQLSCPIENLTNNKNQTSTLPEMTYQAVNISFI